MEIFGWIGMVMIQGSSILQLIKTLKRKSVKDVSLGFWIFIGLGLTMYLIYAIHIADPVYIASNGIGLSIVTLYIVIYFLTARKENNESKGTR